MGGCRQVGREGVVVIGLRVRELLAEMPPADGKLSARHEMPGQFAKHRLVGELLVVDLLKRDVAGSCSDVKSAAGAGQRSRRTSLRELPLRCPWDGDGPCSLARLILVESAHDVVDNIARSGLRHEANFFREGVRRIGEYLVVDKTRARGSAGVIREVAAIDEAAQAVGVVLQRR